ncbi:MAG: hypothetical protein ACNS60_16355 [Candidatus Cyclobacteriaceae bacterium M2_1C_046]
MKYIGIILLASFISLMSCNNKATNEEEEIDVEEVAPDQEVRYEGTTEEIREMDSLVIEMDKSLKVLERDLEKTEKDVKNLLKDVE